MYSLITVLLFIVCLLLILIVLVQNSKGGGLASNFQSSNQIMGVRKTTDFLEKATWALAGALLFLCIAGTAFIPKDTQVGGQSAIKNQIENAVDPNQVPSFPAADVPASTDTTK
jgi:preprotein translocase subunit SecG